MYVVSAVLFNEHSSVNMQLSVYKETGAGMSLAQRGLVKTGPGPCVPWMDGLLSLISCSFMVPGYSQQYWVHGYAVWATLVM